MRIAQSRASQTAKQTLAHCIGNAMIYSQGIDHLVLRVIRIDQMLSFYCNAPVFTVERRQDEIGLIQLRALLDHVLLQPLQ
jgi:hypothetical protein